MAGAHFGNNGAKDAPFTSVVTASADPALGVPTIIRRSTFSQPVQGILILAFRGGGSLGP